MTRTIIRRLYMEITGVPHHLSMIHWEDSRTGVYLQVLQTIQHHISSSTNSTISRLSTITNNGSPISYTYDANGNIKTITQGSNVIGYTYYGRLEFWSYKHT